MMLVLTLVSVTAAISVGLLSARVAAGVARDLRDSVFTRVLDFSSGEISQFSSASLITRATNDVTQLQTVTQMIMRMVFYAPIVGIGGFVKALNTAPSLLWVIGLMVVVVVGVIISSFAIVMPKFKIIQQLLDKLNLVMRENLNGLFVVRAFNQQKHEENRFDLANKDLTKTTLFVSRVMVFLMPLMMLLMSATSLLVVWAGAQHVEAGLLQVGDMMAFMQYTMQIFMAFMFMAMMFFIIPRASVSAERIAEILNTTPQINDPDKPLGFSDKTSATVEFRDVSFHYPDAEEDVLHNVSFTAKAGKTTAFIGTTGSGKSTVVSLIPRFYDLTKGEILINGINIKDVNRSELRDMIGYIPQKSNLFTGTIRSNLLFGDNQATEEALLKAAEIAQAAEFINNSEDGLETAISQGGGNVSGGQRQRLAIARALVKKAPILIFDDSFSALDFRTDASLRAALKNELSGSTIFLVSQRVATIKNSDQIIVLDEGKIIGIGNHSELLETNEIYRDIALSQLTPEELK
ncbi:MAG TPA: ABC transporter ATP-binding protein, partial [Anaerolineales bacterium]|nr:ABC transporter ATP-binding protein [Anaerolineales bacterium]